MQGFVSRTRLVRMNVRYKAVIFDLFGTLVNTYTQAKFEKLMSELAGLIGADAQAFTKLWVKSSFKRSTGGFASIADTIRHMCGLLDCAASEDQIRQAEELRIRHTQKTMQPRPEAETVLNTLKSRQLGLGLISDCSPEVPGLWQGLPIAKYFDATFFSCQVQMKKPDVRIYRMACEHLDAEPDSCLYVGDGNSRELWGAQQVGLHPVRILPPMAGDPMQIDCDDFDCPTIATLNDIFPLLEPKREVQ